MESNMLIRSSIKNASAFHLCVQYVTVCGPQLAFIPLRSFIEASHVVQTPSDVSIPLKRAFV